MTNTDSPNFISKFAPFILFFAVLTILLLALHPAWMYHLRVDIDGQYTAIASQFLNTGNLSSIGYNEYLPGAVMFFVSLSPYLSMGKNNAGFLAGLFVANVLLIIASSWVYHKSQRGWGVFVFALILLFTGPIILYRHELLVGLMASLAVLFWIRKKTWGAFFLLGIATSTKIYPIILVPYFVLVILKNRGWKALGQHMLFFVLGLFSVLAIYMGVLKVPLVSIVDSLSIHSQKPVHVESVWGSILTVYSRIENGDYALGKGDKGIFGIDPQFVPLPLYVFNYFWVFVLGIYYAVLALKLKKGVHFEPYKLLTALILFLITSKILTPQYMLWVFLLLPLVSISSEKNKQTSQFLDLALVVLTCFLGQYIYPLNYNELVGIFYANGAFAHTFWMLFLRNALLVILTIRFARKLSWNQ